MGSPPPACTTPYSTSSTTTSLTTKAPTAPSPSSLRPGPSPTSWSRDRQSAGIPRPILGCGRSSSARCRRPSRTALPLPPAAPRVTSCSAVCIRTPAGSTRTITSTASAGEGGRTPTETTISASPTAIAAPRRSRYSRLVIPSSSGHTGCATIPAARASIAADWAANAYLRSARPRSTSPRCTTGWSAPRGDCSEAAPRRHRRCSSNALATTSTGHSARPMARRATPASPTSS